MKIAVINCENAEKWKDYVRVIATAYGAEGSEDEFVEYQAFETNVPTMQELEDFDGVIVPGSRHSVNDSLPWLVHVENLLIKIVEKKRPQLFCTCFGHQLLAKALGGTVSQNVDKKFIFRSEEIETIDSKLQNLPYMKPLLEHPIPFLLIESHGDCVKTLPREAARIATSKGSENEIFVIGDHVLSVQSHPEFDGRIACERIFNSLLDKGRFGDSNQAKLCKDSVLDARVERCNSIFRVVVRKFLLRDFN